MLTAASMKTQNMIKCQITRQSINDLLIIVIQIYTH